eukprot:scaffold314012_cov31-Tisochrysis_lutea.AAC.1
MSRVFHLQAGQDAHNPRNTTGSSPKLSMRSEGPATASRTARALRLRWFRRRQEVHVCPAEAAPAGPRDDPPVGTNSDTIGPLPPTQTELGTRARRDGASAAGRLPSSASSTFTRSYYY